MKKISFLSFINFILIFVPWSIIYLRQYEFALESPNAEMIIAGYSIFIIASFIFSLVLYTYKKKRDVLSSIALFINGVYTAGVIGIIGMSITSWFG